MMIVEWDGLKHETYKSYELLARSDHLDVLHHWKTVVAGVVIAAKRRWETLRDHYHLVAVDVP
jgi:hypothetical protein